MIDLITGWPVIDSFSGVGGTQLTLGVLQWVLQGAHQAWTTRNTGVQLLLLGHKGLTRAWEAPLLPLWTCSSRHDSPLQLLLAIHMSAQKRRQRVSH